MSSHPASYLPVVTLSAPAPTPAPAAAAVAVASRPARDWPGLGALALTLLSLGLLCGGDPMLLTLPTGALGTALAAVRVARGVQRPPTLIALHLGIGALLFWVVLQGLLGLVLGYDVLGLPQFSVPQ